MITIEAEIDEQGHVRVLQPISIPAPRRALVVILDEPAQHVENPEEDLTESELDEEDRK